MESAEGASELNTDGQLSIGGNVLLPSGLPKAYYHNFIGCILRIVAEQTVIHLEFDSLTTHIAAHNLTYCD